MIDNTLINSLKEMAKKEHKIKQFKKLIRIKGKIIEKSLTKNKNIKLKIKKADDEYNFVVMKTHKERFAIAEKLEVGKSVYVQGISRFRAIICTKLRVYGKGVDEGKQSNLKEFG